MKTIKEEIITSAIESRDFSGLIDKIPYAKLIGIQCISIGDSFIFHLPKNDDNLGNPTLPALHGGVIGGFMESSAILHVMMTAGSKAVPKVVDFSIDYLRPGRHCDSYAQCDVIKQGRNIANVHINTWQVNKENPIATARAHFLMKT